MIQTQDFHVKNFKHTLELCSMHLIHAQALLSRVLNRLSNILFVMHLVFAVYSKSNE